VITTGEGGAAFTNSEKTYEALKLIRSHGRAETSNYFSSNEYMDYVALGYNFRMSDITAALGIAQLGKVDRIIEMRREIAGRLSARLCNIRGICVLHPPDGFLHTYQIYTIRVKDGQEKRDALLTHLARKGIMSKVYFHPVHLTHFYKVGLGYNCDLPVTEKISQQILSLPMYPSLSEEEINFIADAVMDFFS